MRHACDSDSRCGLACDASARDAKSLAMWVERCEPLSTDACKNGKRKSGFGESEFGRTSFEDSKLVSTTVEFKNDYVLGFIICEIFTVITLQDWVGWGIFTVILGYPRRASGDSQHLEARSELQDWLRFELFTVKNTGQGPFRNN